jgi:hypothetical protein
MFLTVFGCVESTWSLSLDFAVIQEAQSRQHRVIFYVVQATLNQNDDADAEKVSEVPSLELLQGLPSCDAL